jgi:hypothetical protein
MAILKFANDGEGKALAYAVQEPKYIWVTPGDPGLIVVFTEDDASIPPKELQIQLCNQGMSQLDAAKLVVKSYIKDERDRREQAGFKYLGKVIDSDSVSVQRICVASTTAQMALSAEVAYEVEWACKDNSLLTLNAMGVLGMMQALGSYGLNLHYHARNLRASVDALSDIAEVREFDHTTGWPE